jgi:hypothetical protein
MAARKQKVMQLGSNIYGQTGSTQGIPSMTTGGTKIEKNVRGSSNTGTTDKRKLAAQITSNSKSATFIGLNLNKSKTQRVTPISLHAQLIKKKP